MLNSSLKIFYFIFLILFFYFVLSSYFSKNNISKIRSKNSDMQRKSNTQSYNLPILKSDTDNVIMYDPEGVAEEKIKKRKVWELLK